MIFEKKVVVYQLNSFILFFRSEVETRDNPSAYLREKRQSEFELVYSK